MNSTQDQFIDSILKAKQEVKDSKALVGDLATLAGLV